MNAKETIEVRAVWDHEASVWVATSDDVPGLVTEADNAEELVRKLQAMIPDLLRANGLLHECRPLPIPLHLLCERTETIGARPC
jgi:predicted RNase H-like HicB family nuclease